ALVVSHGRVPQLPDGAHRRQRAVHAVTAVATGQGHGAALLRSAQRGHPVGPLTGCLPTHRTINKETTMVEIAATLATANSLSAVKPPKGVTVDDFRDAMRELAGGVAVITVGTFPDVSGFTATSVTSLSVEPPRVIVSVTQASSSYPLLQKHKKFGVNMLAQ